VLEVLKALELYYSTNGEYPLWNGSAGAGGALSDIAVDFYGAGKFIRKLPAEAVARYYYCISTDKRSMLFAVNTEQDKGGSNFCRVTRGPATSFGCDVWQAANASSLCQTRF
jgi:hypothetical protein